MLDNELMQKVTAKAEAWLNGNYSEEAKSEIRRMLDADDKTELVESFYKDLEFGTGGLRGIMGMGSNRMNIYTVGAATQGLSNYLNRMFSDQEIKVSIGHDCRNNSRLFAETAAQIFTANGIKVFLVEALRPTPEISYAIRHLGCQSGCIVTASHNPKEYNGFKVYWEDGAQIIAPHDVNIIAEVEKIKSPSEIKFEGNNDLITIIGEDIDAAFLKEVKTVLLSPEAIAENSDVKIVYTPIHGTGITLIPRCLKEVGFENVILVDEQTVISGDFPTVDSPNPEEPAALNMAIEKAKEVDGDIVMASDPDADRMGLAVKNNDGEWILLNGNQTNIIFTYYILKRKQELGQLTPKDFMVKTIVTSELIKTICDKFEVELLDCYTGFKWIANEVRNLEGKRNYIGGGEESYGYMAADFIRDKCAVSSCALMAEITAWAKSQGKSVFQLLQDIYVEFGYSREQGISVVRKGKSGAEEIVEMMKNFRQSPKEEIDGSKVRIIKDFQLLKEYDVVTGDVHDLDFPGSSNVLQYFCEDGTKVSVRPSGTEPKIKFYIEVQDELKDRSEFNSVDSKAADKVVAVREAMGV